MLMPGKILGAVVTGVWVLTFIAGCTTAGEQISTAEEEPAKKADDVAVAADKPAPEEPVIAKKEVTAETEEIEVTKPASEVQASAASPRSSIYLGSDGRPAGLGDPNKPVSEAYRIGMGERPAALAGVGLPKDKFGLVDWVEVVKEGEIKPVGSLDPNAPDIPPFDMDIVIAAKGDFVKDVHFPHDTHTYWLGCENCHPAPFVMGKGKNKMSMVEIAEGKWCGVCHGKVAFPLTDCARCHKIQKAQQKPAKQG